MLARAGVEAMCSSSVLNYHICDRCYVTGSQDSLFAENPGT